MQNQILMQEKLDPSQYSQKYLRSKGFGFFPRQSTPGKILMLCPLEFFDQIPMGTLLTSISGQQVLLHESHDQEKIDGKPNPYYIDKDYRYYGGSLKMLGWGIYVDH